MDHEFEGKVALITGAGSGIGRQVALSLAALGTRVVVADRDEDSGGKVMAEVEEAGGTGFFTAVDVARGEDVEAMVAATKARFGRLDMAVNNAGVGGVSALLTDYPENVWQRVLAVNLSGVWLCMKHQIPLMLPTGGSIVNVASIAGLRGFSRHSAYAASKHGVVGLTKSAALEYAKKGIRINAVCPGFTETPMVEELRTQNPILGGRLQEMNPMKRLGTVAEIAQAILFLCSRQSGFVTGHSFPVDGGMMAL